MGGGKVKEKWKVNGKKLTDDRMIVGAQKRKILRKSSYSRSRSFQRGKSLRLVANSLRLKNSLSITPSET